MGQSCAFTWVRYKILAMVILSCVFVIIAFSRQDWMREEFSMKMGPIKRLAKESSILNTTAGMIPASSGTDAKSADAYMNMIPDDSTIDLKFHFGLKKSCIRFTASGIGNPIQLLIPVMSWCYNNDIVTNPEKYNLPSNTKDALTYLSDGIQALKNAYICLAVAMVFIVVALIMVVIKAFKWPVELLIFSSIACLIACICISAGLLLVHSKFDIKQKYDQAKSIVETSMQYGSRKRRDDYGQYGPPQQGYQPYIPQTTSGASSAIVQQLIAGTNLKESIGSPLVFAGLSIGLLLIVILLSIGEYFLVKRSGGIKYENMALS